MCSRKNEQDYIKMKDMKESQIENMKNEINNLKEKVIILIIS